ncbi:AsmA family protein [Devosia sp. RR2S18]|uniref:AsmA family protein n=1 Tax=Devosia rhizosphaerae TaxID=3049774 RepID=UPI002541562A|nr:AsmA-like C-terminal region-containing protein [Devosia sp. RR2S18]WIJ26534.1 AsmA-like C-terminal region-containing protein [Devosia sp. RR2S18]
MPTLRRKIGAKAHVLNRIYIIVGLLAIVVLAGAFLAPRFIQWGDYRTRMEELATGVLGTPVTIRGEIEFSLLPQPQLRFTNVLVGSPEEPAAIVDAVEAEFALMDFLRDNYTVTDLVLTAPVVDFSIDESGLFSSGVSIESSGNGIGLGQASITRGVVRVYDRRTGETFSADNVDGELALGGFSGPLQFQGAADYRGTRYGVRFNSAQADAAGLARVSAFVSPQDQSSSVSIDGAFTTGIAPKFDGTLVYRQSPPAAEAADEIRGDLVLESTLSASTDRVVLSGYTLQPDENRASARLTGAASIQLGARRSFDAVISGGVFSLPPRDANEDASTLPYELVRLLEELPAPLIPELPGQVGIDLAEVGLRGFAIRNLRLDASTDGEVWAIERATAQLPGETVVQVSGDLGRDNERPNFSGSFSLATERLDALAQLWRKPSEDNPLFNQPGRLEGRLRLGSDALGVSDAMLTLGENMHGVELRVGFGEEQRLDVVGQFEELSPLDSAILAALLPEPLIEPRFAASFPSGSVSLAAEGAHVLGLSGTGLLAEASWTDGGLAVSRLTAAEWGGLGLDGNLALAGTLAEPQISGELALAVPQVDAPALLALYDVLGTPVSWREALARSAPADLVVGISPTNPEGGQILTIDGVAGVAELDLRAELGGGATALTSGPLRLTASLEAEDADQLALQLGLDEPLFSGDGSMLVFVGLEGSPANSLEGTITASMGAESVSFSGDLLAGIDGQIQGVGQLDVTVEDASGLAAAAGASGISLPQLQASAGLRFEGDRLARLSGIAGTSDGTAVAGDLDMTRTGPMAVVEGGLTLETVSVEGLAAALFGEAALVPGAAVWPEGPIDMGGQQRSSRGDVAISAPSVAAAGEERMTDASFEFAWDETRTRLSQFAADTGEGAASFDLTVCCAGPLLDKTVSGRLTLAGAALAEVLPSSVSDGISGVLEGGVQFEATGSSIAELMGAMSGEGNLTVANLGVDQLAPEVFPTIARLEDVLTMDGAALEAVMGMALERGAFTAPAVTGAFTIAGGVVRLTNFIMEGEAARLAGTLNLALPTLALDGSFALTPLGIDDANGLVTADTARIIANVGGTLLQPGTSIDLEEMVAAVQVRANELEVERLEVLRQEDAERQRAAAEERNRLIEAQRQRAAEEAARLAAEEEARLAAEEEARAEAEDIPAPMKEPLEQIPEPTPDLLPNQPGERLQLTLPPPVVNQPIGPGVNQPVF